jgi:flagellar hook-associated protein 2
MSVDGLVSGLDTTSLINQLMQLEAAPQQALQTKVGVAQQRVAAYQSINTRFAALSTAADALGAPAGWSAYQVASTTPSVTATVTTAATPGELTFTVCQLATSHALVSGADGTTITDPADPARFAFDATGSFTLTNTATGAVTTVTPADGSLQAVVSAVNAAGAGVRAATVQVAPGQYRLALTATSSGAAGAFTVTDLSGAGGLATVQAGQDAQIHVGPSTGGYDVTSTSNTFTDVLAGLTFTVSKTGDQATLTVATDAATVAGRVKAIVDAANAALDEIAKQTRYDAGSGKSSPLTGDFTARALGDRLLGLVSTPAGGGSLADYGITLTSDGHLAFATSTFTTSFTTDPTATQAALTGSFVVPTRDLATSVSAPVTGSLAATIQSANDQIRDLQDGIAAWDTRLANHRTMLQRQFSALEVALGAMQQQSAWLAGRLASLPLPTQGTQG